MIYTRQIRVEFNHCDPAGIVFYPRYFEMTNSVAENFFRDVVQLPYEEMMARGGGVPTARLEVTFHAPSRLGDLLDWRMQVLRLGGSSLDLSIEAQGADRKRVSVALTLVNVNAKGRPQPWSDEVRQRITTFIEAE
ncbi:thioesterase family protein [Pseudotabrizicola sp. 4114]|uniref:acyl-CoA thioesterase n=1 Tax=Pseudotabrizicola sp. 4114 TaxID=2817731 RepID=UPI002858E4F0|nr:4-hydroxybenzoyl-CoA thioesterase [Pseudorhodobacter sp. 4114]